MVEESGRLGRRLGRILLMLPYAIQHPGVSVDELARKFGVNRRDLLADLDLVFLCGLPGYGPGDLIDVDLDEERVYVRMADYFAAPLRLTPAEALVLYAGAAALAELPGMEQAEALKRSLVKLRRALGASPDGDGAPLAVDIEPGIDKVMEAVRDAIARRRRLRIRYFSATRGEVGDRTVQPWGLVAALGRWYLVALDDRSAEERMFRLDRMESAEVTEEEADIPEGFDPEMYRGAFHPSGSEPRITFEISPQAGRWFEDYYPVISSTELPDGWRAIEMVASTDHWAATLVLQLGREIRNVAPESVATKAGEMAEQLIAAHAS